MNVTFSGVLNFHIFLCSRRPLLIFHYSKDQNMGGIHSSQGGGMEDVLKNFEEELKKWNDNVKNLKESWQKGDISWVPAYLRQQMEETETRWIKIKSMIPSGMRGEGKIKNTDRKTQMPMCCQDTLRTKEAEIEQLRKNNEIILTNVHKAELQITEHLNTIKNLKASQKQLSSTRNDQDVQSKQTETEQRNQQSNQEKTSEMEEKSELKKRNEELDKETVALKERIGNLEEEKVALEAKNKEVVDKSETESAKHRKEASEKNRLVQNLQKQNKEMKEETLKLTEENQLLAAKNETLETQVDELQAQKETLLLRLSKLAGENLTKNNSGVADLSDPNRPTKLGEVYSELYDNEWTDAFEALKSAGHKEEKAVETLRLTLEHVMQFCESKAELLIKKLSDAVNLLLDDNHKPESATNIPSQLTMPRGQKQNVGKVLRERSTMEDIVFQQRWKPVNVPNVESGKVKHGPRETQKGGKSAIDVESELKDLRKKMAIGMVPVVQKAYMERNWSGEYIDDLKPYILKCVFIAWMMIVQSPSMALHKYPSHQLIKFDKSLYKEYVTSGPIVSYVVWPALLLKENGPVVCKGVAEGIKTCTA